MIEDAFKMCDENGVPYGNPAEHPSGGEIRVKQSEVAETDINKIVERHVRSGLPIFSDRQPTYGDFSNFSDFHSALNQVMDAQDDFMELPADVREACGNDVGRFLDLVSTPEGLAVLQKVGLDGSAVPEVTSVSETPVAGGSEDS